MSYYESEAIRVRENSVQEELFKNEEELIDPVMKRAEQVPLHSS